MRKGVYSTTEIHTADYACTEIDSRTTDGSTYVNDNDRIFDSFCTKVKATLSCIFKPHPLSVVDYVYLAMLYILKNWNDSRIVKDSREYKKLCDEIEFFLSELKYDDVHVLGIANCISCPRIEEAMQVLNNPIAIQIQFKSAGVIRNYQFVKDIFEKTIVFDTGFVYETSVFVDDPINVSEIDKRKYLHMIENAEDAMQPKKRRLICCF